MKRPIAAATKSFFKPNLTVISRRRARLLAEEIFFPIIDLIRVGKDMGSVVNHRAGGRAGRILFPSSGRFSPCGRDRRQSPSSCREHGARSLILTLGPDQLLKGRIVAERNEVHLEIKIAIVPPLGNRFSEQPHGGFLFAQERRDAGPMVSRQTIEIGLFYIFKFLEILSASSLSPLLAASAPNILR